MTIRSLRKAAPTLGLVFLLGGCGQEVEEAGEPTTTEAAEKGAIAEDSLFNGSLTVDTQAIPGDTPTAAATDSPTADTAEQLQ